MASSIDTELVSAANKTRKKKREPIILPPGIALNTFGRVTNIREGPALSASLSPPENSKTAGIIIRPARKAITVSNISI